MKIEFVPLWDIERRWPEAAPFLQLPLARQSAMSLDSVFQDCKRGKFHLWIIPEKAAFVTEIQQYPQERICMIVLCGGEGMQEWVPDADATLSRYAVSMGCNAMMIVGRRGWSAVAPAYRVQDTVMRKQL